MRKRTDIFSTTRLFLFVYDFLSTGVNAMANIFGVGAGTVNNCTNRFIDAVNKLGSRYIVWPYEKPEGGAWPLCMGEVRFLWVHWVC